jgi:hypothetical protein
MYTVWAIRKCFGPVGDLGAYGGRFFDPSVMATSINQIQLVEVEACETREHDYFKS